jgi:TetR/AcrR family transcriptional regulator, transcriptional repressor for nem operon
MGEETRTRILDAAQALVAARGFGAVTVEELIARAGLGESAFLAEFRDEGGVEDALLRRLIEEREWLFDEVFARARDLAEDPLQVLVVGLRFLADRLEETPGSLSGGVLAASCHAGRRLEGKGREIAHSGAQRWRARFRGMFEEVAAIHAPREAIGADDFADMASGVIEGGFVVARALGDPAVLPRQVMMLRSYVKLLFAPDVRASGAA